MIFKNYLFFGLFLFIPLIFYFAGRKKHSYVRFSYRQFLKNLPSSFKIRAQRSLFFLRLIILCLLIIGLTRPQSPLGEVKIETEGIDIVLAVDCSGSMLAEDFKLKSVRANRLDTVKEVVKEFVGQRKNDRIGIAAFAARSYTVCPLTLDYGWLITNLERIKVGMIEDGTAVGSGIAASLNRLKNSKAKSKVIILLTDGRNNTGSVSPLTAAEAASALGIKIYTIGAGSEGFVPYPAVDFFGNRVYQRVKIDLDEDSLKKIAELTGARYFRAQDTESLRRIYQGIDRLEKTPIKETGYMEYKELFGWFVIPAMALFLLEIILANTVLVKLP